MTKKDAMYMMQRLLEATKHRQVGDLVRSYRGDTNSRIVQINGSIVHLENGEEFHVTKVRDAQ